MYLLVDVANPLQVVCRGALRGGGGWLCEEERVVGVASGVLLRLEERVEVPEAAFHILVRWHFFKAHLQRFGMAL